MAVEGPCTLVGVIGLTSVAGEIATLYDGLDAGSGRAVFALYGLANLSWGLCMEGRGIELSTGLYLALDTDAVEVTVIYDSLER